MYLSYFYFLVIKKLSVQDMVDFFYMSGEYRVSPTLQKCHCRQLFTNFFDGECQGHFRSFAPQGPSMLFVATHSLLRDKQSLSGTYSTFPLLKTHTDFQVHVYQ